MMDRVQAYKYKSEHSELLRHLRSAKGIREKHQMTRSGRIRLPHSRDVGAGFIAEDIDEIRLIPEESTVRSTGSKVVLKKEEIEVKTQAFTLRQPLSDYNLREIEEMINFAEKRRAHDHARAEA